jgi:CheY-like chemotaxis protein
LKGDEPFSDRISNPYPHVVIVDLKMPLMSGFEILEWIRDNPYYRVIPTIVLSTSMEPNDVQRAYELGANTYFTKPSRLPDLQTLCFYLAEYWNRAEIPPRRRP